MRYVALAALVVLVGGYVVGQQPEQAVQPTRDGIERHPILTEQHARDGIGVINDLIRVAGKEAGAVGRYVPFGTDRLLDTTNGTLFQISGDAWVQIVELKYLSYEMLDDVKRDTPVSEPQYEIIEDPNDQPAEHK